MVVRLIAPHLVSKKEDPAVVVLPQDGRFAVSLLSGHLGGGNQLAWETARLSGGQAVISTATDVEGLPALEMLAREDRPLWERLFGAAETEFFPLDLVERREDFRTMPRDRFTLFRLEEPGKPLHHVRTSVQIREPLVCLIKWDETGRISVFR